MKARKAGAYLDLAWILTIFAIGFLGSFISGMVGIGGSIVNYPMLLFIPPLLGFVAFSAQEVSAISAVQVFFASMMGMLVFRKGGFLHKQLVLYMGATIIVGSFLGSFISNSLPSSAINFVYAVLAPMIKHVMKKHHALTLPQLIELAQEQGVKLVACTMTMDLLGLQEEELLDGIEYAGVATYLGDAAVAKVNLFI
jgi:peroxiredoxin family protein